MKVLSVILSVAVVFSCVTTIYATSSGSALTYNDQWLYEAAGIQPIEEAADEINDLRAVAADPPDGSSSNPYYVRPTGTNSTWYHYDYQETVQSSNHSYTNFNSMFAMLSQMIAEDFLNLVGYFDDVWLHGTNWNLPQALDYIMQPLWGGTNDDISLFDRVSDIWSDTVDLTTITGNMSLDVSTIITRLNTVISDIVAGNTNFSNQFSWEYGANDGTYTLPRYRQNLNGGTSSDLTPVVRARNLMNSIWYMLNNINTSMVYGLRDIASGVATNSSKTYLDKDLQPVSLGRVSLWHDVRMIGGNINDIVARLGFVLASDDEIEARAQAANNQAAIVEDFVDPTGAGSISVSDIGDMAGLSESMKDTFSSNVDPSLIFDGVGSDSHAWDWFTNDVKNSLACNPSRGSDQLRSAPSTDSSTPYLDAYYRDVQEALGVSLW